MSNALVYYNAAHKALALALRVDEVKSIRDKAMAMQLYAKQAKDHELIDHATDIRLRAERRLGEVTEDERKAGKLAKGGGGKHGRKRVAEKPTLKSQHIDKNLADRARKAAGMPEGEFEAKVARAKPDVFRKMIVEMFPSLPRLEMFARGTVEGFDVWGNEATP